MRFILLSALSLCLLGGCARDRIESTPNLTVVENTSLPTPSRTDITAPGREGLIGPLDEISINVYGVEELNLEMQVDPGGTISIPLVGSIDVAGKTPYEVGRQIESALLKYVRDPFVSVNVLKSVSQVVTVDGAVTEPGLYPVTNQMTLMRAVASAKGVTEDAKLQDVVVIREVGGQRYAGLYNLAALRRGAYADPAIYANDVVIVGDSPARRLFQNLIALSPLLTTPLIILLQ